MGEDVLAWNEVNHASQPTYKKPGLAVRYYDVLRKDARKLKFKVMAADILDTSNMARTWLVHAQGQGQPSAVGPAQLQGRQPPHVGRHAADALDGARPGLADRDRRDREVRELPLQPVAGRDRTKYMFQLADRYDSQARAASKITQLYVYRWFGEASAARASMPAS